jgi:hypothetical protein
MEKYLAMRIKEGKLNYTEVIEKFPNYKEKIDSLLKKEED